MQPHIFSVMTRSRSSPERFDSITTRQVLPGAVAPGSSPSHCSQPSFQFSSCMFRSLALAQAYNPHNAKVEPQEEATPPSRAAAWATLQTWAGNVALLHGLWLTSWKLAG